jgi:hypothetical protein
MLFVEQSHTLGKPGTRSALCGGRQSCGIAGCPAARERAHYTLAKKGALPDSIW